MTAKLVIKGTLPGLNEYIDLERGKAGKQRANALKQRTQQVIGAAINKQLRGVRFTRPVTMHYTWVEKNRRRDKDNIAFARKFVQDALVRARVLENDGWRHVEGFTDSFAVDKNAPRVEVIITDEQ